RGVEEGVPLGVNATVQHLLVYDTATPPGPRPSAVGPSDALTWRRCGVNNGKLAVLVTFAFSVVGVVGDYFLKLARAKDEPLRSGWFYVGFAVYASTAFGWVFVMRHLKLATVSVVYSVSMVLLMTAMGVLVFRESLNGYEVAGLLMAVASLILLTRFG